MSNKPFEKLDQMLGSSSDNTDTVKTAALKKQREELKKRFLEITEGNYDKIPLGWKFASELPGIKSTSISKAPSEGLCIYIAYDSEKGKEIGYTFSLFKDGTLSGNVRGELQISKEQL